MTSNHIKFKYSKDRVEGARSQLVDQTETNNILSSTIETKNDTDVSPKVDVLKVTSLVIDNFKGYKKLNYSCNNSFNIIIGENNIGKSTIFDAFLLWEIAYNKLITSNNRSFYKTSHKSTVVTISIIDLAMFRIADISNLFNDHELPCYITIKFKTERGHKFNLCVEFEKADTHNNYIRINIDKSYDEFMRFYEYFVTDQKTNIRDVFSIRLSQPVANIIRHEQFLYNAQLKNRSNLGYAFEVLRNKILNTSVDKKFSYLEKRLNNVLNRVFKIRWKNLNKDNDVHIDITIQEEDEKEVDLALVGSGVLNLLEIFSSLYVKNLKTNILLLDEPDSHIHSEIQSKLINELKSTSDNSQIFIISHNDRLIHSVNSGELFYINNSIKKSTILKPFPLDYSDLSLIHKEMAGSLHREQQLDDNPVLFVEGKTDAMIIRAIIKHIDARLLTKINIKFGNGHGWVAKMIIGWHFFGFKQRAVGLFDYDNAATESIELIKSKIPEDSNYKIRRLERYKPEHLICFFKNKLKVPFAIEEMFDVNIWNYFEQQNYLVKKSDVIKYNDKYTDTDVSFNDYCKSKITDKNNLIYLKKVDTIHKISASKYIVSQLENKSTKPKELIKLIEDIFEDTGIKVEDKDITSKKTTKLIVRVSKIPHHRKFIFAVGADDKDYHLKFSNFKCSDEEWHNIKINDELLIVKNTKISHENAIPTLEIQTQS